MHPTTAVQAGRVSTLLEVIQTRASLRADAPATIKAPARALITSVSVGPVAGSVAPAPSARLGAPAAPATPVVAATSPPSASTVGVGSSQTRPWFGWGPSSEVLLPMAASNDLSITLPAERASIKRARDFVARVVADHVDDPAEVLLMTSELVANVVVRVGSAITITVRNGPVLRVEIHNHQAATEAFRDVLHHSPRPAVTSPTGRGLSIMRSLASRIGLDDDTGTGKIVWFEWEHPASDGDGDGDGDGDEGEGADEIGPRHPLRPDRRRRRQHR